MTTTNQELTTSYRSLRQTEKYCTSIILPAHLINQLGWKRQDNIKIQLQDDTLILTRASLGPCHNGGT
jgi:hypothetical protein